MTTYTAKGLATRQRVIEGASDEIRLNGVELTTLDDVMRRTRTSKSQLFHYFPGGREELLLAVASHEAERVLADQQPHLSRLTSWRAWQAWRDAVVERYRRQGRMCPLGVLMTEIGRSSPAAQAVTRELLVQWEDEIYVGITAMQASGKVAADLDARRAARALLAGIQGGVSILLATGEIAQLEAALDTGIEALHR